MNHEKKKPRKITQIKRHQVLEEIQFAFKVTPVCGLVGPRQCGKTTTANELLWDSLKRVFFILTIMP